MTISNLGEKDDPVVVVCFFTMGQIKTRAGILLQWWTLESNFQTNLENKQIYFSVNLLLMTENFRKPNKNSSRVEVGMNQMFSSVGKTQLPKQRTHHDSSAVSAWDSSNQSLRSRRKYWKTPSASICGRCWWASRISCTLRTTFLLTRKMKPSGFRQNFLEMRVLTWAVKTRPSRRIRSASHPLFRKWKVQPQMRISLSRHLPVKLMLC